jgi:glycosyltransferase involved in cell wall biosynthesis
VRVIHLAASGHLGGAENVVLACLGVRPAIGEAEAAVVALGHGPFVEAVEALHLSCAVVEPPARLAVLGDSFGSAAEIARAMVAAIWQVPIFARRFSSAVRALEPDVVHSHGIKTHVLSALTAGRVPVIWHLHDYVGARPVSSRLLALLARRCSIVVAVSESIAEDTRTWLPATVPIVVVPNSVDCDRFQPDGPVLDLDSLSGLPPAKPGTLRIGFPATFARWKGHTVFLEALARLKRDDVRGYVVGGATYETRNSQWSEAELRTVAASLGLDKQVGFTGFVRDMPSAYRALDIVVHASTRPEPFGLVIAEAMACGRTVVASACGGASELFTDGLNAVAAATGQPDALAKALGSLVDDSERRHGLGARARAHALRAFGRDRFAADLNAALSRVASPIAQFAT